MATAFDNKESGRNGIFFVVIALIIIFIAAFIFAGGQGILAVIRFVFIAVFIVGFLGFVFYIIYYLFFKKHPRNIPAENWKSYLNSALDNGSDMMEDLILTGDKNHSAKRFMTIKGYLRVKGFDGNEYDMFVGKKGGLNIFEEYKIILLKPQQHSDLISDVYVYGISLIVKYGYYFLNTDMLDKDGIDKFVAFDTYRSLVFETLGDLKGITDRAIGLDAEFRRQQMQDKILKIPVMGGQQPPPNQNNGQQ